MCETRTDSPRFHLRWLLSLRPANAVGRRGSARAPGRRSEGEHSKSRTASMKRANGAREFCSSRSRASAPGAAAAKWWAVRPACWRGATASQAESACCGEEQDGSRARAKKEEIEWDGRVGARQVTGVSFRSPLKQAGDGVGPVVHRSDVHRGLAVLGGRRGGGTPPSI